MKKFSLLWILGWMLISFPVQAATTLEMIFLYPGGQGSSEQAQPLLDQFAEVLKTSSGGKLEAKVKYFSKIEEGETFLNAGKAAAGILAEDLFLEQGKKWQAKVLLRTQMLPSGDGKNQYVVLGPKNTVLPTSGEIALISSRPLNASYIKEQLFPQWNTSVQVKASSNVVGTLRKVGMGQDQAFVLLDQFEFANVSRLKTAWVAGLKELARSQTVPSAPLVVFGERLDAATRNQLKSALLKMGQQPQGKEVLNLLRLKGFQEN